MVFLFLINCKTVCPAGLDFTYNEHCYYYYGESAKANFRTATNVSISTINLCHRIEIKLHHMYQKYHLPIKNTSQADIFKTIKICIIFAIYTVSEL